MEQLFDTSRPTLHYKKEYDAAIIEHMAQGYSMESFAGDVGTSRQTLYNWRKEFPSFDEAIRTGKDRGLKMFETILLARMTGREIKGVDMKRADGGALYFALKTRHHELYSEKRDDVVRNVDMSLEQYLKSLDDKES